MFTYGSARTPLATSNGPITELRLKRPGRVTSARLYFSASGFTLDEGFLPHLEGRGATPAELDKAQLATRARPVYLTTGLNGRPCLVFGYGTDGTEDPLQSEWFHRWIVGNALPETLMGAYGYPSNSTYKAPTEAAIKWSHGRQSVMLSDPAIPQEFVDVWAALHRGVGVMLASHQTLNFAKADPVRTVILPGIGGQAPGFTITNANGSSFTTALGGNGRKGPNVSWTKIGPYQMHYVLDDQQRHPAGGLNAYPAMFSIVDTAHPWLDIANSRLAALTEHATLLGLAAPVCGTTFPYPLLSKRVGWVFGHVGADSVVLMELDELTATGDGAVDARPTWVSLDFPRATYDQLFPTSSIPLEKRETASALIAQLPEDMWFRVTGVPGGVHYGEIKPSDTLLARDVVRAGANFDDIFFDDIEDDKPAVSYSSLVARADSAIASRKNNILAMPKGSGAKGTVSLTPMVFSRSAGVIVCIQEDRGLNPGEALVAIGAGAPYSFTGVTNVECATEFFLLSTWEAVVDMAAGEEENHVYMIDMGLNLLDFTFQGTDDELARGLPLALGWEKSGLVDVVGPFLYSAWPER